MIYNTLGQSIAFIYNLGGIFTKAHSASVNMSFSGHMNIHVHIICIYICVCICICCTRTIVYIIFIMVGQSIASIYDLGSIFTSVLRTSVNTSPWVACISYTTLSMV